jgi:hypothetical protein
MAAKTTTIKSVDQLTSWDSLPFLFLFYWAKINPPHSISIITGPGIKIERILESVNRSFDNNLIKIVIKTNLDGVLRN